VGASFSGRLPPAVVPRPAVRRSVSLRPWPAFGPCRCGRHGDGVAGAGGPERPGGGRPTQAEHCLEGRLWAAADRSGVPPDGAELVADPTARFGPAWGGLGGALWRGAG